MSYYLRGADGQGLGAVPVYENCILPNGVPDSACVARNQALNDAWGLAQEQAVRAQHLADCLHGQYDPALCHSQFDPGGAFDATANAGAPVQTYSTLQAQTLARQQQAAPVPTPVVSTPMPSPSSGGGRVLVDLQDTQTPAFTLPTVSGGTMQTPGSSAAGASSSSTVIGGFDLSAIPVWAWLAAAGVALFAFGGGRGR